MASTSSDLAAICTWLIKDRSHWSWHHPPSARENTRDCGVVTAQSSPTLCSTASDASHLCPFARKVLAAAAGSRSVSGLVPGMEQMLWDLPGLACMGLWQAGFVRLLSSSLPQSSLPRL